MSANDTSIGIEMLEALKYAEQTLRIDIEPNADSIACVTHLQAIIHRAKRMKKAGTL